VSAEVSQLAVIKTRLPYVDQRALSQAWFSALHLATSVPELAPSPRVVVALGAGAFPLCAPLPARSLRAASAPPTAQLGRAAPGRPTVAGALQDARLRARTASLARAPKAEPRATQFAVTASLQHARVRLAMRQDGRRLHVIAVCSARHAPAVRRALALAAIALQMHGVAAAASVRIGVNR
jgi:hypothetical protein